MKDTDCASFPVVQSNAHRICKSRNRSPSFHNCLVVLVEDPEVIVHAIQICAVGGLIDSVVHAEEDGFSADRRECVCTRDTFFSGSSLS